MKAAAFSFNGVIFNTQEKYYSQMLELINKHKSRLAVFPAHSALLFAERCGLLGSPGNLREALKSYMKNCSTLTPLYLEINVEIARAAEAYLVPGTFIEKENDSYYLSSAVIGPEGDISFVQRQTHLSREERAAGLSRGTEIKCLPSAEGTIGLLVGSDAWYPEVSRILGLQGAQIVCHPGSIHSSLSSWYQLCGMWKEVQQNQFFGVESQLAAEIAGEKFSGHCAICAPCEMTPDKSGYLTRSAEEKEVSAYLDFEARQKVIESYPLYQFLNPQVYRNYMPSIYRRTQKENR